MEENTCFLRANAISRTSKLNRKQVFFKGHLQILIGFVLGFFMAFAMLFFYERIYTKERDFTATENYKAEYMKKEESMQHLLLQEVRVLCMVLTCPENHHSKAAHVLATWGRRCSKLIFVSSEANAELGVVEVVNKMEDTYDNLWNKTREGFRYVFERYYEDYDWFLKADDDTYIIMENLRYMLYGYYPETPIYFGHQMMQHDVPYMSGGASYILSKESLRRFMTEAFHNESLCPAPSPYAIEDFYMGVCLQSVGVHLADSKFATSTDNKPKMFPIDLLAYMEPQWNTTIPAWLMEMSRMSLEVGLNCCSNYSIAFHYVDPARMYAYEFFIYHLQAFGLPSRLSTKLPCKISTKNVERLFPLKANTIEELISRNSNLHFLKKV